MWWFRKRFFFFRQWQKRISVPNNPFTLQKHTTPRHIVTVDVNVQCFRCAKTEKKERKKRKNRTRNEIRRKRKKSEAILINSTKWFWQRWTKPLHNYIHINIYGTSAFQATNIASATYPLFVFRLEFILIQNGATDPTFSSIFFFF